MRLVTTVCVHIARERNQKLELTDGYLCDILKNTLKPFCSVRKALKNLAFPVKSNSGLSSSEKRHSTVAYYPTSSSSKPRLLN